MTNGTMPAVRECFAGGASVRALACPSDFSSVAIGAARLLVQVVDCRTQREVAVACDIEAIAFSPSAERLALGCKGGRLLILDAGSCEELSRVRGDAGGYHELAWSPDGRLLAAGQYEPFISIVDGATGALLQVLDPDVFDDEGRTAVAFSPDGRLMATTAYNAVLLWSADQLRPQRTRAARRRLAVRGHAHMIDLAFSSDGRIIAALALAEGLCAIHVWNVHSGKKLARIPLPRLSVRLAWAGKFIAVGEAGGDGVSLWSTTSSKPFKKRLAGLTGSAVTALVSSGDGSRLYAGTDSGKVFQWTFGEAVH